MSQKKELKSRVRELQAHLGDPLDDTDSVSITWEVIVYSSVDRALSHALASLLFFHFIILPSWSYKDGCSVLGVVLLT